MKNYYFISQFYAPYPGSFIASLVQLARELEKKGNSVTFVFPNLARDCTWIHEITTAHDVMYTSSKVHTNTVYNELLHMFKNKKPDVVHSHFDGYDINVAKAAKHFNSIVIWHVRCHMGYSHIPRIAIRQMIGYVNKFFYCARKYKVYSVCVSKEMEKFIILHGFKKLRVTTITNGIDISKLNFKKVASPDLFKFLTFGGRNISKRIDIICEAEKIIPKHYAFEIIITEGVDTKTVVKARGSNNGRIKIVSQTRDVQDLYSNSNAYISASVGETFSNAIAEASFSGLLIIQSDIEGTRWNQSNPNTLVFKVNNHISLAECMMKAMDKSRAELQRIALENHCFIKTKFSISSWAEEMLNFYKKIINNI